MTATSGYGTPRVALAGSLLLAGCLAVAGCGPSAPFSHEPVQPQVAPKRVEAERVELRHTVLFDTDRTDLGRDERMALDRFARSLRPSEVSSVAVVGHADERASSGYNLDLSARRAGHVAELLSAAGLPGVRVRTLAVGEAVPASQAPGEDGWRYNRRVTVVAESIRLVLPNCPDWSARIGYEPLNRPMSNLGCANALNFAAMLADPRDLVDPGDIGPPDPTHASDAVQRYRNDEVKVLTEETASE